MPLKPVPRTGQPQNRPPSGPASNTRSRTTPPSPTQQSADKTVPAAPMQNKPHDSEKEAAVSAPQKDDEPDHSSESAILHNISLALDKTISNHQMSDQLKVALTSIQKYANKTLVERGKRDLLQITIEDVRGIRKDLLADISGIYSTLENKIGNLVDGHKRILQATETLAKEAKGINAATKEIETTVTKVKDTTNTIASTTTTYRDALLSQPAQPTKAVSDLRLQDDIERKAKQILVRVYSDEMRDKSLAAIKDMANKAITEIDETFERPEKVEVENVTLMRNGAVLLQLNTRQAADWLREPGRESKFADKFANDTFFINRNYNIIVPRTPITFNPTDEKHIREIEECNNLDKGTIRKARWIKPAERRREGQTHAYASLAISSPTSANRLIRSGITICGATSSPFKMKQEPMQCMRCRGWGHYATHCTSEYDVCGTCGDKHRTSNCNNPRQRYCASCKVDTHASWDRNCPEFIRRSESHSERFPENKLPFFPTEENWTLTTRPDRIPIENRFPQRFAVNSLPTANTTRQHQRPQGQTRPRPKRQNKSGGNPKRTTHANDPNSIEKYLTRSQPATAPSNNNEASNATNTAPDNNTREEGELPVTEWWQEPESRSQTNNTIADHILSGNLVPSDFLGWN